MECKLAEPYSTERFIVESIQPSTVAFLYFIIRKIYLKHIFLNPVLPAAELKWCGLEFPEVMFYIH